MSVCASCGSSDTRKISVIFEEGTQDIGGRVSGVGLGVNMSSGAVSVGGGGGSISGVQQTRIAQKLSPPPPPSFSWGWNIFLFFVGGGLIFPLYFVWRNWQRYSEEKAAYPAALQRWQAMWYCLRCGNVFTPK